MPMQMPAHRTKWWRVDYLPKPDFTVPAPEIREEDRVRLAGRLACLYGPGAAEAVLPELVRLIKVHQAHKPEALKLEESSFQATQRFCEQDMMLITYGDMVRAQGKTGLAALGEFLDYYRRGDPAFSILHVLPFFPSSSDRGYAVIDFHTVSPDIGSWEDIRSLGQVYRLMFDGVLNHASSQSKAFQEMLCGNPRYKDFAISFRSPEELTPEVRGVLRRPRTSDVLSCFQSIDGPRWVWTTFSQDQIDLNYHNPEVLLKAVETLLFYVRAGADLIRLDAVTYLWKELGTSSASLEQTHQIVKLFRDVLDLCSPQVILVTESNVPHGENISYFGNGHDEAQLVYNFALPPLVLHAFYRESSRWLSAWAAGLQYPSPTTTYLNILDTHDGIGLSGVQTILPEEERNFLVREAHQHGAFVSNRTTPEGDVPYEINTTWYSALNLENNGEAKALQVQRFVASRSIALALRGVPALYLHSLAGSRSDLRLALQTKVKRDVNRAPLDFEFLARNLAHPGSKLNLLSTMLGRLLMTRVQHKAFHPNGEQKVLALGDDVFALLRVSPARDEHILCVTNITARYLELKPDVGRLGFDDMTWFDLVGGRGWHGLEGKLPLRLGPFEVLWLAPFHELEARIERTNP
jgi:glucosylglycerate phosphorylase